MFRLIRNTPEIAVKIAKNTGHTSFRYLVQMGGPPKGELSGWHAVGISVLTQGITEEKYSYTVSVDGHYATSLIIYLGLWVCIDIQGKHR